MRTSLPPAIRAVFAAASVAISLAASAASALAQEVHALEPSYDTVQGTGLAPRLLPIRLLEGAPCNFEVKADRGSAFRPRAVLLGLDRAEDASALWVPNASGTKVSLKGYVPKGTGLHWIRVEGADGTMGPWTFKSKVNLPKGASSLGDLGAEGVDFPFVAPGQALATVSVKGAPKESGPPAYDEIRDPDGAEVFGGELKPTKTGFLLAGVELPKQGRHVLSFLPGPGGPGTYKAKVKWKVAKGIKRTLDAGLVIADPFLLGIDPVEGDITDTVQVTLQADFAQPGATVRFRYGTVVGTILPASITHVPGELRFPVNLSTLGLKGVYDVELSNPDGGAAALPQAFTVNMVSPELLSVDPAEVYQGAVRRVRVFGGDFFPNVAARLRMGGASIPGTVVGGLAGYRDVDFDLAGAAHGAWDVCMTNAGAPEAVLPGALDVLETVTVASMSPPDNAGDPVVAATILGGGFLPGATAELSRDGGATTIAGTGVVVSSRTEMHAVFDTSAATFYGLWDLVVTVPGGAVVTLPEAFETLRPRLPPTDPVVPFSATTPADGPPALAHDPASGEYLVAWAQEDAANSKWHLYARRLDADGEPLGDPVEVSDDDGTHEKRYAVAGHDPVNGEYLVVWTETKSVTPTQTGIEHPSGKSAVDLFQVMAQRLDPSDLSKIGTNVQVTDSTQYQGSQKGVTWVISDFHSYRPAIAFDRAGEQWEIAWMEEFDTTGLYAGDDYDVFQRTFQGGSLGGLRRTAASTRHEGDPALAWDAAGERVILAYVDGDVDNGRNRDLWLDGNLLVQGSGDDLGDPALAVDGLSGTVIVAWSRAVSDGTVSAEAAAVALSDLSTVVGSVLVLGKGATDTLARPVVNPELEDAHVVWTRKGSGGFSAMRLPVAASADGGLAAAGDEDELSAGSGDEGLPAAVYGEANAHTAVVWLERLTETGNTTYKGDVLPKGTIRGEDFWFQLFR